MSFAQSVENMFYLSFLIRDGKVSLDTDEKGEPTICCCEQPTPDDYTQGLRKQQIVFELDMATWKRAIDVFQIKEPTIPTREASKMKIGNKFMKMQTQYYLIHTASSKLIPSQDVHISIS